MPTMRERVLELSPLPAGAHTLREHLIAIQLGTGSLCIYGEEVVTIEPEISVSLEGVLEAVIEELEYDVVIERDIVVECE